MKEMYSPARADQSVTAASLHPHHLAYRVADGRIGTTVLALMR